MKTKLKRFLTGFVRAGNFIIEFFMSVISFSMIANVDHKLLVIGLYTSGVIFTYLTLRDIYRLGEELYKKKEDSDV